MARDRKNKEVEELRGIIRQQAKRIKNLSKQKSRAEKLANKAIDYTTPDEPELIDETPINPDLSCSKCGKHDIKVIDLKIRLIYICQDCGQRKSIVVK